MKFFKLSAFVAAVSLVVGCGVNQQNSSVENSAGVFGGKVVTNRDSFAYHIVGVIDETMQSQCTGSLIDEDIVLTAAHCVSPNSRSIRLVFSLPTANGFTKYEIPADSFLQHPNYNERTLSVDTADMALIHFKGGAPLPFKPVDLDDNFGRFSEKNGTFIAAGYGVSSRVLRTGAGTLRTVHIPFFDLRGDTEFTTTQFKEGICNGDSGGPLFKYRSGRYIQVGVASRASKILVNCMGMAVFTRVDVYLNWIAEASETLRSR